MEIQIKETAACREKVVKSYAQRQKEYRMRKKIEKLRLCPKKIPKTNAENQRKYRQNLKEKQLSESLILARRRKNAERAKRYRDNLKLKKQLDSMLWTEDSLSSVLIKYTKEVGNDETNCEELVFSQCQTNMNQIPSMNNGAQQVISPTLESFEAHNKCSTPNALLNHETNIAVDEQQINQGTQVSQENKLPEQSSHSNQLIIPKTEVLDEVEITFEDCEDNKNFITPKKELTDSSLYVNKNQLEYKAYLLKLVKTESSEDIDQPQQQHNSTKHTQTIQTQHVSEQKTIPNIKMEPGLGGSVLAACAQTCAPPLNNINMEELPIHYSQTDNLITPKKEILDNIEVTFENPSEGNTDLITPKEEVSNRSLQLVNERQWEHNKNLLKPIKTETIMSEDIARLRRHKESTQTLIQITKHSVANIKVEPGAGANVSRDCAQTDICIPNKVTKRSRGSGKDKNGAKVRKVPKTGAERIRDYRERIRALENRGPASEVPSTATPTASQHLDGNQVGSSANQSSRSERNTTDKQEAGDNRRQIHVQVKSMAGSLYLTISTTDCEESDKKRISS